MPEQPLHAAQIPTLGSGEYWDTTKGLVLRVRNDRRTWTVRYRVNGRRRRVTLGTWPTLGLKEARQRARDVQGAVDQGKDPQGEREAARAAETFGELAELYLERHARRHKRPKSVAEDARILEKDLLPAWRDRKAREITRRDVRELLEDIVAERDAPVMANRVLALISTIFNVAIEWELLEVNPAYRMRKPGAERSRERVLTDSEIRDLWRHLAAHSESRHLRTFAASYRLTLLTAQRPGEVKGMRWDQVEGDLVDPAVEREASDRPAPAPAWWTIPAEVAKNKLSHRVPLSPAVVAELVALEPLTGRSPWVLESPRRPGHPLQKTHRGHASLLRAAGLRHFVPHDLRRTAASGMTRLGVPRLVVEKILNHSERGVAPVYDRHSYDPEKRQALELWSAHVLELVS
jgi:integrase